MIHYTPSNQLSLEGFSHPFDQSLSPDNRWVRLAKVIPWDELASVYSRQLSSTSGRKSIDVRMVIGAIIIKHKLGLDDRETVQMISENIYLQYFCGLKSFQTKAPFHPTVFVDIRKRMGASSFDTWNSLIITRAEGLKQRGGGGGQAGKESNTQSEKANRGVLKIDATVAEQQISYPTDSKLLHTARKESEALIDELYKQSGQTNKPRTYRRIAAKEYIRFSKKRRKTKKDIRRFNRKQLNYLKRNFKSIEVLLDHIAFERSKGKSEGLFDHLQESHPERFPLDHKHQRMYWILQEVYRQQKDMYDRNSNSTPNRIVSIYQPHVRPIVRGKDGSHTEFGAKLSASEVDGMSRVERIGWDNFNESKDLKYQAQEYKQTYGYYPELLLADKIYLNRENRRWMKERGIRIVGKPLGRRPKEELTPYQKQKLKKEQGQRNLIEAKFGQAKNGYGLNKIRAKTKATSESWISAIFFVMNLVTLLKIADRYAIFCAFVEKWIKNVFINPKQPTIRYYFEKQYA